MNCFRVNGHFGLYLLVVEMGQQEVRVRQITCQLPSPTLWTSRKHYCQVHFQKVLKKITGCSRAIRFASITIICTFHILLLKGRYFVRRPWTKTWSVFFFLNSTLITATAFPTRRTLASISISSYHCISKTVVMISPITQI